MIVACKYKSRVWDNGWCNVACMYCTLTQERNCKHNKNTNMAKTVDDVLRALRRLKGETGSLACFGCGREHNCGIHGCAILRDAIALIEELTENRSSIMMPKEVE